jgi:hypothetical protein
MARYKGRRKSATSGGLAFRFIAFIMGLALAATSLSVAASPAGATGDSTDTTSNLDCPPGYTFWVKFELNDDTNEYEPEGDPKGVTVTGDGTGGEFTSEKAIGAITLKGANDEEYIFYNPPANSGSFNNENLLTPSGEVAEISHITFCLKPEEPVVPEGSNHSFSNTCETVTIGEPTGVKPEDAEVVVKLDGVKTEPGTYPTTPGEHVVTTYVNGTLVDTDTFTVEECKEEEPEYYLETSHETECGAITITLRNVSPWIYPVSYSTDGSTPDANGPNYGPVVDNRGDAPDDQTKSKTLTFTEDQGGGTVTVKYVVAAGTESDLYVGKSVGEVTTVVVDTDCKPEEVQPPTVPVIDECGPGNAVYGEVPPGPWSVTRNPDGSVAITANQGTTFPNGQTTIVLPPPVDSNVPCPTTPPPPPPVVTPPVPPVVVPPVVTPPAKFNPTAKIKSSCVTAQWGEAVAVLNNKKSDEKKARFTIVKPGRDKIVKVKAGDKKRVILTGLRVGSVLKVKVGGEVLDKTRVPKGCEKPENPNTGFRTIAGKVLDKVAFWKRNTTA